VGQQVGQVGLADYVHLLISKERFTFAHGVLLRVTNKKPPAASNLEVTGGSCEQIIQLVVERLQKYMS
jgi:hypothetical protein